MTHLLHLQRTGNAAETGKMLEAATKLGVNIDLAAGRWSTADGRAGTTDPFSIDTTKPAATPAQELTLEQVKTVVTHLANMAGDAAQAGRVRTLLDEAKKNFGLDINLA